MRVETGRVAARVATQLAVTFLHAKSLLGLGRATPVAVVPAGRRRAVGRSARSALCVSHASRPEFDKKPGHVCRTRRVAAHDFFGIHNGSHVKISDALISVNIKTVGIRDPRNINSKSSLHLHFTVKLYKFRS